MKSFFNLAMFFALLGVLAYMGSVNLSNVLWMLTGVFVGSVIFIGLGRNGFLETKKDQRGRQS